MTLNDALEHSKQGPFDEGCAYCVATVFDHIASCFWSEEVGTGRILCDSPFWGLKLFLVAPTFPDNHTWSPLLSTDPRFDEVMQAINDLKNKRSLT